MRDKKSRIGTGAFSAGRARAVLCSLSALIVAALAIEAPSAFALEHSYSFSFSGSGPSALSEPTSADVDNSSGPSKNDVYVTDAGTHRVEKFDPSGNFLLSFGSGDLTTPKFLAVDSSTSPSAGDVYVADTSNQTIRKYTESGSLVTGWAAGGVLDGSGSCGSFSAIGGIDVDSTGRLIVFDVNNGRICRFAEDGTFASKFEGEGQGICRGNDALGFAVAPDDLHYYKVDGSPNLQRLIEEEPPQFQPPPNCVQIGHEEGVQGLNVDTEGTVYAVSYTSSEDQVGKVIREYQFDGTGQPLDQGGTACVTETSQCEATATYGEGHLTGAEGVGVSLALTLYVADTANHEIDVFSTPPAPLPETQNPTGNDEAHGNAVANGTTISECYFEFGSTPAYGKKENCELSLPFTVTQPVSAKLPGLIGENTYHYRLVLGTGDPKNVRRGADRTITPHFVKGLKTEDASGVTRTTAELNGSFEGTNEETTYFFEYGTSASYGSRYPAAPTEESAGKTTTLTHMQVTLPGLIPDTTYHFRVVGKNSLGTSPGKDKSFKTPLAVQGVTTEHADGITRSTAVLHGSFTGNGEAHTFSFEWGPTAAYGHVSPGGPAGSDTGKVSVEEEIEGLEVQLPTSHPYHYRLVATNSTGSSYGADQTFSTLPPLEPTVGGETAEEVTPTGAKLNAVVNPGEGETVFEFQYGTESSYGSATPVSESVGSDLSDHPVSAKLSGLAPGTTYHYRVVAYNFAGTAAGGDQTFTTPDVPAIVLTSSASVARTSAKLTATVGANSSPTSVHFEFGTSAGYGASTAAVSIGEPLVGVSVSSDLNGLSPGTTYHYRAVATNGIGTTIGPDQTFTTAPEETKPPETQKKCKKSTVKKHGKCVKKKKTQHRKHHRHSRGRRHG